MAEGAKEKRLNSKRMAWSLLLSAAVAVGFLTFLEFSDNGCRIFWNGYTPFLIFSGAIFVYLSALFLLPWWGRGILLFLTLCLAISILTTNIDGSRIAATQASAVGRVRRTQELLEAHKRMNPKEGYPATIPMIKPNGFTDGRYRLEYTPIRGKNGGPAEDYIIRATPIRPDCGCRLNIMSSSDRLIHKTYDDRPATKADPTFEPQS